jgi:hypothetical protein
MARLFCPWCRRPLPEGDTNCPRCGLRIAPLERRRNADVESALAADGGGAAAGAAAAGGAAAGPLSLRTALLLGAAGGAALVGLAAAIAAVFTRGAAFGVALSNSAFFTGGAAMTLALVLGGVRISRLVGDIEQMKARARGVPSHAAHDHVRLCVATAAAVPLGLALVLAAAAH